MSLGFGLGIRLTGQSGGAVAAGIYVTFQGQGVTWQGGTVSWQGNF